MAMVRNGVIRGLTSGMASRLALVVLLGTDARMDAAIGSNPGAWGSCSPLALSIIGASPKPL